MLSNIRRALRMWRAKSRLMAPYASPPSNPFFWSHHLQFLELQGKEPTPGLEIPAYEYLAVLWHGYAQRCQPDYASFLGGYAAAHGATIRSVLDIACGTGVLASRLVESGYKVVGLDLSEPMLAEARSRFSAIPDLEFIQGDYRDFHLGRQFDAAVCAFNSINYVEELGELEAALRCVAEHVRPGGLFTFDAFAADGMLILNGGYFHGEVDGVRFVLKFAYDSKQRRETSEALLPQGVEFHRRIPIEPRDVVTAAAKTGWHVDDYFSSPFLPGWLNPGGTYFYLLTRDR